MIQQPAYRHCRRFLLSSVSIPLVSTSNQLFWGFPYLSRIFSIQNHFGWDGEVAASFRFKISKWRLFCIFWFVDINGDLLEPFIARSCVYGVSWLLILDNHESTNNLAPLHISLTLWLQPGNRACSFNALMFLIITRKSEVSTRYITEIGWAWLNFFLFPFFRLKIFLTTADNPLSHCLYCR